MAREPTAAGALDLGALSAISDAVESGLGLPEVVRAASRALGASLVLIDRSSAVLAVAARSSADERALMADAAGVSTHELRVGEAAVGRLRLRGRGGGPAPALVRLVCTLLASEVERVRAPAHASEAAAAALLSAILRREVTDRDDIVARAAGLGADLAGGGAMVVVRARRYAGGDDDWRPRFLAAAARAARASAPGALAAQFEAGDGAGHVVVLVPAGADVRRVAEGVARELRGGLHGITFAVGHSRPAADPADLHRAGNEALLAANVADAGPDAEEGEPPVLAFDDTGAYRLLLPAMSEDRGELQRFFAETIAPLVAYDDQYETDLVGTLETFLDADGNVAGTAQRLFTHRHTVRYRLERVRDITGLDISSSDGRERLSLGLKAMRVLGIAVPRGPATEQGAGGGRVQRERDD